jgi:uncharacterized heparinase superfamily protein
LNKRRSKAAETRWAMAAWRRRTALKLRKTGRAVWPFGRLALRRFLFAPPDLRTTDAAIAADIYAGQFVFTGRVVNTNGMSPFDMPPPTQGWAEALYGFGWLRHLHAANSSLARDNARALVADFVDRARRPARSAIRPQVISRRLMAFLSQSPLVLDGADHDFYMLFLRAVRDDALLLRDAVQLSDDPFVHLAAAIALTALGLCVEGAERMERRNGARLSDLLDEQILADGGHISRNPRVLIDLMLDLLPLRSTYAARGLEPPQGLVSAIDRIVPHLKMLRHPDGSIALFNGMGASQVDALATIFASHDTGGFAATEAPYSGYQRLAGGSSVLIVETGPSPPFEASSEALAGCLSFEFSHGRQRIFVNCGIPRQAGSDPPVELRASAAHTGVTFAETSSCRFVSHAGQTRVLTGPRRVTAGRSHSAAGEQLALSHDGYKSRFGIDIERVLGLSDDGLRLEGREQMSGTPRSAPDDATLTARFHLHPVMRAQVTETGDIVLASARGLSWRFAATGGKTSIEDSMFFAGIDGMRRTQQIVVIADDPARPIAWQLAAIAD